MVAHCLGARSVFLRLFGATRKDHGYRVPLAIGSEAMPCRETGRARCLACVATFDEIKCDCGVEDLLPNCAWCIALALNGEYVAWPD